MVYVMYVVPTRLTGPRNLKEKVTKGVCYVLDGTPASSINHNTMGGFMAGGGDADQAGKPGLCKPTGNLCSEAVGSSRELGTASSPLAACKLHIDRGGLF